MIYYVYLHIKESTGDPFYVGKGCKNRIDDKYHRSKFWNNVVNKHGYDSIFLEENLTEKQAFELEMYWIKRIGRRDIGEGTLVNMTNGGEGESGRKCSQEFKDKCSKRMIGNTINNGRKHSEEVNKKKGKPGAKNIKAKKVIYNNIKYGCIKDLYNDVFKDKYSYGYTTYLINKNKIKIQYYE